MSGFPVLVVILPWLLDKNTNQTKGCVCRGVQKKVPSIRAPLVRMLFLRDCLRASEAWSTRPAAQGPEAGLRASGQAGSRRTELLGKGVVATGGQDQA